jgi:Na+-transporting methylmalonyl-CoA/oxaloacetate decarboxylase gamma subunit
MCRKFTLIFATNFVGSLIIRASREVFPIEVRSPEIVENETKELVNA